MKRHLQFNRHHPPTSPNIAPVAQNCIPKSKRNLPKTVAASFTARGRFEHDPSMIRTRPPVRRGYFSSLGNEFCIENYNISRSGYLSKFRRPRKITPQDHQILRLPRKMSRIIDPHDISNVIKSNRTHPPTSPSIAAST